MTKIKKITKITHTSNRYDIKVANVHNFFANGILVHNSNIQIDYIPELNNPELINSNVIVISKGLGAKGLSFKDNEDNANNLYMRAYKENIVDGKSIVERIIELAKSGKHSIINEDTPVYILGEVFGPGVQKGFTYGFDKPTLRVFDIYIGLAGKGRYLHEFEKMMVINDLKLERVPILYFGPWNTELIERYTSGKETLSGQGTHMREGMVITPQLEWSHRKLGRVILKSVSAEYLTRSGDTTEYS